MQEDKEAIFDAIDTVKQCLNVFPPMLRGMKAIPENMLSAAKRGFINATDLADYLTKKGLPFRSSYKISGQAVAYCIEKGKLLDTLTLDEYKAMCDIIEEDVYKAIDLATCVETRISDGGTGSASIEKQIAFLADFIKN
jgi:argininosuccinate lyase